MLDRSEICVKEICHTAVNIYKLCLEEMGYDLGPTNNEIDYHNFLADDPIKFEEEIDAEDFVYEDPNSVIVGENSVDFSNYKGGIISVEKLTQIFPKGNKNYMAAAVAALDKYGSKVGLNDKGKLMVLAQFAHESGNFIYTHEIGYGKGRAYGKPAGPYGRVYYGRGPIQITWETNYKQITQNCFPKIGLNVDIHKNPDLCCTNLEIGCAASLCWFMLPGNGKRAIAAANAGDVRGLTKAINGGYNGLQDRIDKTNKIFRAVQ